MTVAQSLYPVPIGRQNNLVIRLRSAARTNFIAEVSSMRNPSRRSGFTLIELLVVVAIIGLLISILLPALSRAKEQGRIGVCLSNERQLGTAANAYMLDNVDFLWAVPFGYQTRQWRFPFGLATEFIYGGGMPDKTFQDYNNAGVGGIGPINPGNSSNPADVNAIPPRFRPVNRYVDPGVSWDQGARDPRIGANNPRTALPADTPGIFRCPSDKTVQVPSLRNIGTPNPPIEEDLAVASWDYWGNSYPANWYWAYYFSDGVRGGAGFEIGDQIYADRAVCLGLLLNSGGATARDGLGAKMLNRDPAGGWESQFVMIYENMFNYAAEGARPQNYDSNPGIRNYVGWHGQLNFHSAVYRDGHADYGTRDTRYVRGTGWTTWPNLPWTGIWSRYQY